MTEKETYRNPIGLLFGLVPALISLALGPGPQGLAAAEQTLFSPEPAPRPKILFDYYHHVRPATKVGEHLVTGGWADNVGRYGWDDFSHTNSFDPVFIGLEREFSITIHESSFTAEALAETDAVVIVNPDSPALVPNVPVISDEEIGNLNRFVREGGSLLVLINSAGHATEKFEDVQLRKLVRGFGLDWNDDDTHYSNILLGNLHPYFYDVPVFHYGAGCTIDILENASDPKVLMEVYSDPRYPDRDVRGPGIVMVHPGKGKVMLVGDTGSWGANISRPWSDNGRILKQMFRYLKPSQGVEPPQFQAGQTVSYDYQVAGLTAMDFNNNSLTNLERPKHRMFRPRPKTALPYLEASGSLTLGCTDVSPVGAATLSVKLDGFRWFDNQVMLEESEGLKLEVSRLGKVAVVEPTGISAQYLAADAGALVALLPVDGIRIGDRWESIEQLRIPTLKGSDLAITKPVEVEITYVRDQTVNGRPCRVLRASTEVWLDAIDVDIEDVLPQEQLRKWGGPDYEFYLGRGGSLLVKREQWVDKENSQVVEAKTQTRIVAWIHDLRRPVGLSPDDKDKNMVTSFAHIVTFTKR